jgi:hypothetical protein
MSADQVLHLPEVGYVHGLSQVAWAFYVEAAAVMFESFHPPPPPPRECKLVPSGRDEVRCFVTWVPTDERSRRTHAESLDATCDGAYAVAAACLFALDGWCVMGRTHHGSGADWYMLPPGATDPDADLVKLEVSGVAACAGTTGMAALQARLRDKIAQTTRGDLDLPAVAVVVGFETGHVLISEVRDG